jgi:hypothetical protein
MIGLLRDHTLLEVFEVFALQCPNLKRLIEHIHIPRDFREPLQHPSLAGQFEDMAGAESRPAEQVRRLQSFRQSS